ncbi:MAG TPA: UDP-N-acetylglucosamine 2-epimerase (non-hydrolyzing) [Candidatus Binatia bacterium]|nr:UDP-N-acetylglucosamine 2-epimerase (non-hydrolyzing) [Candidatus Binatia bacterium]
MRPLRVMPVFGTRPDTIKMAPVVEALAASRPAIEPIVCVSAQHRQMLDTLLELFEIKPEYDLDIMEEHQTLGDITTRVLAGMEDVLKQARPDVVLVHGDTTTSTAAALAAFYAKIPVGHVEAGLRTRDRYEPFPEEMNRRMTGVLASFHFAPTATAKKNLLAENVDPASIVVTGNTVIDAFMKTSARVKGRVPAALEGIDPARPLIFVTAHRRENHAAMPQIAQALADIAALPERPQLLWPVHPSPMVAPIAHAILDTVDGVRLIEPIDYADLVGCVAASHFVLTDSGGLQEEAPCLGKPVLVMRDVTERPEGLAAGTLELVGADRERIVAAARRLLVDDAAYARMARASNPYGDGHAGTRIASWLLWRLREGARPDEFSVPAPAA